MGYLHRKRKLYKSIKFYDADFTGRIFMYKSKPFRERGVFYARQHRRLSWKITNNINPYKLRRRRRTYKSIAFLMKQRIKFFYRHFDERQFRKVFSNARQGQRKHLKSLSSAVMRLFERRLDNALMRLGIFSSSQIKDLVQKKGIIVNGKICFNIARKLSTGDLITFPEELNVRRRFLLLLRRCFPMTRRKRGDKSFWKLKNCKFNLSLGFLKAGHFLLDIRTFTLMYGDDLEDGQATFFPFDFDALKILKIYQPVK